MGYANNQSGIYRIYFFGNNKSYIGLTKSFKARKNQHLRMLREGSHCNIHLQRAFNIHGEDNFRIELIEECDKCDLDKKEKDYIEMYDSFKNGFNLTTGGENCNISEDVKKRISEKHKGKIVKEQTRKKLRDINLGKRLSKEHKNKISISNQNRDLTKEQREQMSKGGLSKKNQATRDKMSKSRIGFKISDSAKLKLSAYNLKKARPNSLIEIKNDKIYIDGYEYVKGIRTPLEQEAFLKEKEKRKIEGIRKRSLALTGQKRTKEQKEKISKSLKGLKRTLEQNLANSNRQKGIKRSEAFKKNHRS